MGLKSEDNVDYTCQHDEPGNQHVNGNSSDEWRRDRYHAEDDQQYTP
jgi:hypothetical protein